MNKDMKSPIGVFDSGLGGISVLRQLLVQMPGENYVFFGDRANAPYGSRNPQEVLALTEEALSFFRSKKCKAMVIACNTATSVAADPLRKLHPDIPILGIEPALKPAVLAHPGGRILLMATPLATETKRIRALAERFQNDAEISLLPCPGLVELIEEGHLSDVPIREKLQALFQNIPTPDAVVLGCTHYPHIAPMIRAHFENKVTLYDGGEGTARRTRSVLAKAGLLSPEEQGGKAEFFFSSGDEKTLALAQTLLKGNS